MGQSLTFAALCGGVKHLNATAVRFYAEAFAAQPGLADNLNAQHRYNAACVAALAGTGQGKDVKKLSPNERGHLRSLALAWLQADLISYRRQLNSSPRGMRSVIAQRMQTWLTDDDLAAVRRPAALVGLPATERYNWEQFWHDVQALRHQAAEKGGTATGAGP